MASYRLRDDLSFCLIAGRTIFLDMRNDRYFRLSGKMERAFIEHVEGAHLAPNDLALLVERNILTDAPPLPNDVCSSIGMASRSALEWPFIHTRCGIGTAFEVLATVCWTQTQLKMCRLRTILNDTVESRRRNATPGSGTESCLLNSALVFLRARKIVPVETCCLLEALSITTFLTRRRLHANIVFGVTSDPFSAHCWVQSGDIVLNDTIGNTRAYTVIRVI